MHLAASDSIRTANLREEDPLKSLRILSKIATATALMNAAWIVYHFVYLRSGLIGGEGVTIDFDPSVALMHIRIEVALIIAASCLWLKRTTTSLLISIASLVWVVLEYCSWYAWSVTINRESGVYHSSGFYGANLWNWLVIVVALGLLVASGGKYLRISIELGRATSR